MVSIEIIQSVKKAEEQAEEIKQQSVDESLRIIAEAHAKARQLEEQLLLKAEADAKNLIADAKKTAEQEIEQLKITVAQQCDEIKQKAAPNLDSAIARIVERVVNIHGGR